MSTEFYTIYSLVDITATGVTRYTGDNEQARNQQRNWETILQVFSLRAQPIHIEGPVLTELDVSYLDFGSMYEGRHRVWVACIGIEHQNIYIEDANPVAGLESDFAQVPVIIGLEETARFMLPIFYTHGAIKNIYFKPGQIDVNSI
jgi:hypothetical protein